MADVCRVHAAGYFNSQCQVPSLNSTCASIVLHFLLYGDDGNYRNTLSLCWHCGGEDMSASSCSVRSQLAPSQPHKP